MPTGLQQMSTTAPWLLHGVPSQSMLVNVKPPTVAQGGLPQQATMELRTALRPLAEMGAVVEAVAL